MVTHNFRSSERRDLDFLKNNPNFSQCPSITLFTSEFALSCSSQSRYPISCGVFGSGKWNQLSPDLSIVAQMSHQKAVFKRL